MGFMLEIQITPRGMIETEIAAYLNGSRGRGITNRKTYKTANRVAYRQKEGGRARTMQLWVSN